MRKRVVSMLLSLILLLTAVDLPVFAENAVASVSVTDSYYRNANVTSVKDQGAYGLCWAFSTIAACEAELLQNNGANSSLDLSELHLGYYGFNRSGDPLGNYSDASNQLQTIKPWYEAGHNQYAAMNALASWGGVVDESTAPYSTGYTLFEGKNSSELAELEYGQDTYHLENTYMVHKDNLADVKQAILNYGGVVMGFCADEGYMTTEEFYDATNNSLYHPEHKNTSHEAFVIGWDDNFDKFSNPGGHVPSAPGAWIVKNSWGSDTNDEGYFYISYYDQTISTWMFAYDMESADNYDNNYQYESDISGIIRSDNGETQSQESVYEITPSNMYKNIAANVFEASANPGGYETLEAVSFFSYATEGTYTVKIYTNLDDDSNPMSGTLEDTITGDFRHGGYRTIPTSHPIILREGTKYSVVVDIVDAEGNHLGVSSANSDFGIDNKATAGRSFYAETSSTGIYWRDLSDYSQSYVQIKAFTNNQSSETPTGLTLDKTELYMATSSTGEWLSATPTPSGAKYAKVT